MASGKTGRRDHEEIPEGVPPAFDDTKGKEYFSRMLPTERNIKSTVNVGISQIDAELREEFINTATAAMNEVIDDFRAIKIPCPGCGQRLDVSTLKPFSHFECPICGHDIVVPKWFDNYLLEAAEGMGGMATVYKGRDLTLDREVAVKILSPTVARDAERCELFLNEARTAATINHPAVIPIYTCGIFENQPYIVMQLMKNGSLEEMVCEDTPPPPVLDCIRWMRDIAQALECASRHGIIHHDVKPGNIMLDNDGNAKIGDFGIAQAINDSRASKIFEMTKTWVSPHYVSPEKAISNKEDYRGDIYSLGASFYHIITGETPFKHDDIEELIKQRLIKLPAPPRKMRREIPKRLSNLIMEMMSVNPLSRPTYEEVIAELGEIETRAAKLEKSGRSQSLKLKLYIIAAALITWVALVFIIHHHISGDDGMDFSGVRYNANMDYRVAKAAKCFADGDTRQGMEQAQQAFNSASISPKDLQHLAVMLVIGAILDGERDPGEQCNLAVKRLNEAGVSGTSPAVAIIRFMEKRNIAPEDLRHKLKESGGVYAFAGDFAIFVRELHMFQNGDSTYNKMLLEFESLKNNSTKASDKLPCGCWYKRLPIYEDALSRKVPEGKIIEPLFRKLLENLDREAAI